MATTTAAVTLTSDLLSDNMSVTASIPADFHDANADVEITSINGTNKIEYALFHEGTTLTAS
jgi:hypothetical protein